MKIGYLKHDAHRLDIDREGKDTHRIFSGGAAVVAATSPSETFVRYSSGDGLSGTALALGSFSECDVVLAEGYKNAPWEKIWVNPFSGGNDRPGGVENVIAEIGPLSKLRHDDIPLIERFVVDWLAKQAQKKNFAAAF